MYCQGPYEESTLYREFMGWEMPWYSAAGSLETLLVGRRVGRMHLVCYLRQGFDVSETYWTTARGVEVMDNSYHLLDLKSTGGRSRGKTPRRAGRSSAPTPGRVRPLGNQRAGRTAYRPVASGRRRTFG